MNSAKNTLFDTIDVMVVANAEIFLNGFVSKKVAYDAGKTSTAEAVINKLKAGDWASNISRSCYKEAKELIKWARGEYKPKNTNQFGQDVKRIIAQEAITVRQIPYIITLFQTKKYFKNNERMKMDATANSVNSEWVGEIKKREEFFVKLVSKKYLEHRGFWVNNFVDRNENISIAFSGQELAVNVNECFLMKATVKTHNVSTYHGGKETMFNRIKILENMGMKK